MKKANRLQRAKKPQQLALIPNTTKPFFGGQLLKGKRKCRRPLDPAKALHLVIKVASQSSHTSHAHAVSSLPSLRSAKYLGPIEGIIRKKAQEKGIRIYQLSIQSNHVHLLMRIHDRKNYVRFIRAITGMIAMLVSGGKKGNKLKQKFFELRPFSRILSWGRDYKNVTTYILKNTLEAIGFVSYTKRTNWYARYLQLGRVQ